MLSRELVVIYLSVIFLYGIRIFGLIIGEPSPLTKHISGYRVIVCAPTAGSPLLRVPSSASEVG